KLALSINADVINEHALREFGGGVGAAGPIASDGDVENNEKWMVENPFAAGGPVRRVEGGVEAGVHVETDGIRVPLDGVEMKAVGEVLAVGQGENWGSVSRGTDRAWAVQ